MATEEGQEFARENGLVFVEASAKSADKVEEAFLRTAELVYQRQFSSDSDEVHMVAVILCACYFL